MDRVLSSSLKFSSMELVTRRASGGNDAFTRRSSKSSSRSGTRSSSLIEFALCDKVSSSIAL